MLELPVADGDSRNTEYLGRWASGWGRASESKKVSRLHRRVPASVRTVVSGRVLEKSVRALYGGFRKPALHGSPVYGWP